MLARRLMCPTRPHVFLPASFRPSPSRSVCPGHRRLLLPPSRQIRSCPASSWPGAAGFAPCPSDGMHNPGGAAGELRVASWRPPRLDHDQIRGARNPDWPRPPASSSSWRSDRPWPPPSAPTGSDLLPAPRGHRRRVTLTDSAATSLERAGIRSAATKPSRVPT
ncbi:hypothetical protein U9M48_021134 [Paspalum notatum var. saurae]|uniref:Uncharacterized protein n=1 Tax=Paspalum notatum var. saurae TaxID=547442 RepID=A0AAQ3WSN6_PASNO